jgi:shikimate kinase
LVGLPGSGKTTVGRGLSRRLQRPFIDSDDAIEQRIGCPIRAFFEQEGEAAFRDVEQAVLEELTAVDQAVVLATGGGAVLRQANRLRLHDRTHVIYLRSSPDEVFRRVRHDQKRPLLQVDDPLARLRSLHTERDPLYREAAHLTIETGRPTVSSLVHTIVAQLGLDIVR